MQYFARHGKEIEGTGKDCNSCHQNLKITTPPLKATCATSCHAQVQVRPNEPSSPSLVVAPSPVNQQCTTCHSDYSKRKRTHYPASAGLCLACHTASPEHLAAGGPTGVTTTPADQSCYSCHTKMDTQAHSHRAMAVGKSCTNCHDPHGSDHLAALKNSVEQTCTSCHATVMQHTQSIHGVIKDERSCLNCHDPHSSNREKLLANKAGEQMCLSCHNQEIQTTVSAESRVLPNMEDKIRNSPFVHAASMNDDGCLSCHNPHSSPYARLAKLSYVNKPYSLYEPGNTQKPNTYALCFQCHDSSMLNKSVGTEETGFRNDTLVNGKVSRQNLHWFHVVDAAGGTYKDNGRSCFVCHDPHGTEQAHNVKSSYPMSPKFNVTVRYTAKPDGGECSRSCHEIKTYTRSQR
jgi:predicted CXXCH cytochrome family protein